MEFAKQRIKPMIGSLVVFSSEIVKKIPAKLTGRKRSHCVAVVVVKRIPAKSTGRKVSHCTAVVLVELNQQKTEREAVVNFIFRRCI